MAADPVSTSHWLNFSELSPPLLNSSARQDIYVYDLDLNLGSKERGANWVNKTNSSKGEIWNKEAKSLGREMLPG